MSTRHLLLLSLLTLCVAVSATNAAEPTCYVVNSLGETLSKVNLNTGQVTNDIVQLGSDIDCAPNQIVIRDTLAYVVNSVTAEIQIIDLTTESTVGYIQLPPGSNPFHMVFYDDNTAYVTLLVANELAKIDINKRNVVWRKPIGLAPGPIVIQDHKAYIGITAVDTLYVYHQGQLAVFDCVGDTLLSRQDTRTNPNALAVDMDGRVHLSCAGDYFSDFCWIYVIETETDTFVDSVYLGGSPSAMAIGVDNRAWLVAGGWAASGEMYVYDAGDLTVIHGSSDPFLVAGGAIGVTTFQDGSAFPIGFYDTLQVVNGLTIAASYAVGDGPVAADFNYIPGDLDGSWQISLGDLTVLIDMLFVTFNDPPLKWRGNINGDFAVSLGDLSLMIDYLFVHPGAVDLTPGPTWID